MTHQGSKGSTNEKKKNTKSYDSVFCLLSDGLESRCTQRRDNVSELLLLFLHTGVGCGGLHLSTGRRWEICHGYIFPVWLRVGGKVVLLAVMGMQALAHGLVCPGIVNSQRFSAAVEAAPAALCSPVSRGWEDRRQWLEGFTTEDHSTFELSVESKMSLEILKKRSFTLIIEPVSNSIHILTFQARRTRGLCRY